MAAKPPLELAVEITAAGGTRYRFDGASRALDRPQGVSFSTARFDGYKQASCDLPRRLDAENIDLNLLDNFSLIGQDGSVAYDGRVAGMPRSLDTSHKISVNAVGWMANARDRSLTEIYVDRDPSAWGDPSVQRQLNLLGGNNDYESPSVAPDDTGTPSVVTAPTGPWSRGHFCEAWYDAGAGLGIATIYAAWKIGATVVSTDTNWTWKAALSVDDVATTVDLGANLRAAGPGTVTLASTATNRRYAILQIFYANVAAGANGTPYPVYWQPAVYGNHTAPLVGAAPSGVYASDVIKDVVSRYCPALNTNGVQQSTYVIPHLTFKDRIDPYDAFLAVNAFHLWGLEVWEDRTLYFGPVDLTDYKWQVRLTDPGTTVDLQGDDTEHLANGIVVQFTNLLTGKPDVLTPLTTPDLLDTRIDNPATLHGLNHWTTLQLSNPTTPDSATQMGRAALAEFNQPKGQGTIHVTGHIRDRAGNWQPGWKPRAGETVAIVDHPNDRPRLITETTWSQDGHKLSLALDGPPKRMDAVFDRLTTTLKAAGL